MSKFEDYYPRLFEFQKKLIRNIVKDSEEYQSKLKAFTIERKDLGIGKLVRDFKKIGQARQALKEVIQNCQCSSKILLQQGCLCGGK